VGQRSPALSSLSESAVMAIDPSVLVGDDRLTVHIIRKFLRCSAAAMWKMLGARRYMPAALGWSFPIGT
jgi:hypothetical protein